jgi:hypothetical protein
MAPSKPNGVCKLTGSSGRFVKCHIIPKSLTPREISGGALLQTDGLSKPIRRFDSWYDPKLVIRKGEDLLANIDDQALKELTKHKLIWRSWEHQDELELEPVKDGGAMIGVRKLTGIDHSVLAKFAISILWRAGASEMKDMQQFRVPPKLLDAARAVILGQSDFEPSAFPIRVFQYVTKGELYNVAPMNHALTYPSGKKEPFFRITANGVFFHIVDSTIQLSSKLQDAKWCLGNGPELSVLGLDYHESAQFAMSRQIIQDTFELMQSSMER